jgi:hypothetical protein
LSRFHLSWTPVNANEAKNETGIAKVRRKFQSYIGAEGELKQGHFR